MLTLVLGLLAFSSILITTLATLSVFRVLKTQGQNQSLPPISILKPLSGLDPGLLENLESFAALDYPHYELLFAAEDPEDPALDLARIVRAQHPELPIRILAGTRPFGLNPKVRNLAAMSDLARHDLLLISDSNVRAPANYLRELVRALPERGMVTNLVVGVEEQSLGARLDALELHTFVAMAIAGARTVARRSCVLGKSMLLRKSELTALGGFLGVKDVLAEDYVIGAKYQESGRRVQLSPLLVPTVMGKRSIRSFFSRRLRWCQLRRRTAISSYLAEGLMYPTALAATWAALGGSLEVAAMIAALKIALDGLLVSRFTGRSPTPLDLALSPLKDLLSVLAWLLAWGYRRVVWRGHVVEIGRGTIAGPAMDETPSEDRGTTALVARGSYEPCAPNST